MLNTINECHPSAIVSINQVSETVLCPLLSWFSSVWNHLWSLRINQMTHSAVITLFSICKNSITPSHKWDSVTDSGMSWFLLTVLQVVTAPTKAASKILKMDQLWARTESKLVWFWETSPYKVRGGLCFVKYGVIESQNSWDKMGWTVYDNLISWWWFVRKTCLGSLWIDFSETAASIYA